MYQLRVHDVPGDAQEYVRDLETTVNYVPQPPPQKAQRTQTYIDQFALDEAAKYEVFVADARRRRDSDSAIDRLQRPVFAMLVFLLLQLPIWNLLLYKYVSPYLYVCNDQGELVFPGMVLKTLGFGAVLVGVDELVRTMEESAVNVFFGASSGVNKSQCP